MFCNFFHFSAKFRYISGQSEGKFTYGISTVCVLRTFEHSSTASIDVELSSLQYSSKNLSNRKPQLNKENISMCFFHRSVLAVRP